MDNEDSKLAFNLREVNNGWVLEINGTGYVEYVFTKPMPALSMIRKVLKGETDPFEEVTND